MTARAVHLRHYERPAPLSNTQVADRLNVTPGQASKLYSEGLAHIESLLREQAGPPRPRDE